MALLTIKATETIHGYLFKVACYLREGGYSEQRSQEFLEFVVSKVPGRPIPEREIRAAIHCAWNQQISHTKPPKWPAYSAPLVAEIDRAYHAEEMRFSKNPIPDDTFTVLQTLFPGDPLLCIGPEQFAFDTMRLSEWRGLLNNMRYIVPNPMTSPTGRTKTGEESAHTLENTGPRVYQVVEFDGAANIDSQLRRLDYLSTKAPLVMAVFSGGKSVHGWYVAKPSRAEQESFFAVAVSLGADPRLWLRSQFTRLPNGVHKSGDRQAILYFNPHK